MDRGRSRCSSGCCRSGGERSSSSCCSGSSRHPGSSPSPCHPRMPSVHLIENPARSRGAGRAGGRDHDRAAARARRGVPARIHRGGERRHPTRGRLPRAQRDRHRRRAWSTWPPTRCVVDDWWAALTAERWRLLRHPAPGAARVPAARARALGLRDRCQPDAPRRRRRARPRRSGSHRASGTPRSSSPRPRLIMSVYLISSSLVTTLLIPPEAFEPGGQANGRALAYLAHEILRRRVRNGLRHQQHPDPLVRRGVGDGRADQHRAAVPPALRDGAGMEPRGPPRRAGLHGDQHHHHDRVPSRRRCAGRGVRHRHPGDDGVGLGRRADLRGPPPPAASRSSGSPS